MVIFQAVIPQQGFVPTNGDTFPEDIFTEEVEMEILELELEPMLEEMTMEEQSTPSLQSNMVNLITPKGIKSSHMIQTAPPDAVLSLEPVRVRVNTTTTGGFGKGLAGRLGGGGGKTSAILFGANVEASNLGVIVDISSSTRKVLQVPLKEIQRKFPAATVVLVDGCGMLPTQKAKVASASREKHKKVENLKNSNKEFKTIYDQLKSEKRLYVSEVTSNTSKGHPINTTHHTFDFLIKNGVDAIYWFADFQDDVSPELANPLLNQMKEKGITVFCHDFKKPDIPKENRSYFDLIKRMYKETGGKFIYETM